MTDEDSHETRRTFLERLGGAGAAAVFVGGFAHAAPTPTPYTGEWDVTWVERIRHATHRAVFDAPSPGVVIDLAARYLDNVQAVYGANAGDVCAVLNLRTRSTSVGLSDAMWAKYPIGEDQKLTDSATSAP